MPFANSEISIPPDPGFVRRFNEALNLRSAKKYSQAKKILLALAGENPDSASVFGILGDVYWQLDSLHEAIQCFTRACELSPSSEIASLGLFHTLWEAGQTKLALDEMKRFLSSSHSPEYARLLGELIPIPPASRTPLAGKRVATRKLGPKRGQGRN